MNNTPGIPAIAFALLLAAANSSTQAEQVDCEPDPGTDMLIEYSDTVTCVFEESSDVDVYHFTARAGDQPFISLVSSSGRLALYGPGGDEIKTTAFSPTARINTFVLPEDGLHTVVAEAHSTADNWDYVLELPCVAGKCANPPVPGTEGFTAVGSYTILDTRYGLDGPLLPGETRHFHTYGDVSDQNQSGGGAPNTYSEECPFALGEHTAANLSFTVIPQGKKGQKDTLKIWKHGGDPPNTPVMYYKKAGTLKYGSSMTVKTHFANKGKPDISVRASKKVHLVIEATGYFTE